MNFKNKNKIIALSLVTAILSVNTSLVSDIVATNDDIVMENNLNITIDVNEVSGHISPYIYGITDKYSVSGVTINSIKQEGIDVSTYNWEENFSNTGVNNGSLNGYELVADMGALNYSKYALHAEQIDEIADRNDIKSKYLTLPMLGMVSKDAYGAVTLEDSAERYYDLITSIQNESIYPPNLNDNKVYSQGYLTYLTDKFGFAGSGGFDGYFLDYKPEDWQENFSFWKNKPTTSAELVQKSAELSKTIKYVDKDAMVFGPSIEGLDSYANLKNHADWEKYSGEYSWFIDYYLDKMRIQSEKSGTRLLDCLDLHYYPEIIVPFADEPIYMSDDYYANALRTETSRILWDTSYVDSSQFGKTYRQFTPLIHTLQASIRMYYPETKLSFSEYNFGGGENISGAIVQADVLGIFGQNDIYMANLNPSTENYDFQKSAINLYTNYDGEGNSFGPIAVKSEFIEDKNLSVYSSKDSDWGEKITSVVINKSLERAKNAVIQIDSKNEYNTVSVYSINNSTAEISLVQKLYKIKDNTVEFNLDPYSVYLFVFDGEHIDDGETESTTVTTVENIDETSNSGENTHNLFETTVENTDVTTITNNEEIVRSEETSFDETEVSNQSNYTSTSSGGLNENSQDKVPEILKTIVLILVALVVMGVLFIVFYDISKK